MYTKTHCSYCQRAKELLRSRGASWEEVNIEEEPGRRDEMIQRSGQQTVPQIWIDETHIGGCDDLLALDSAGKLDPLLEGA